MNIPTDPAKWNVTHVQHWLRWAEKTFQSANINTSHWVTVDGPRLCDITHAEFRQKVPVDPRDLFWTHLELLRKCKFVAVVQKPSPNVKDQDEDNSSPMTSSEDRRFYQEAGGGSSTMSPLIKRKKTVTLGVAKSSHQVPIPEGCPGNRSGNNGQIQLWQFLLELLTDKVGGEIRKFFHHILIFLSLRHL